jgi:hypothetical protein
MSHESGELSLYRPRILTLVALLVVAVPISVANVSHVQGPPQVWPPPNPSFGWPLTWY